MAYQIPLEAIVTGKDVVAKVEQMINTAQKTADKHPIKIGTGNLDPKYVQSINKAIQGIKPIARKNFFGDSYNEAEKLIGQIQKIQGLTAKGKQPKVISGYTAKGISAKQLTSAQQKLAKLTWDNIPRNLEKLSAPVELTPNVGKNFKATAEAMLEGVKLEKEVVLKPVLDESGLKNESKTPTSKTQEKAKKSNNKEVKQSTGDMQDIKQVIKAVNDLKAALQKGQTSTASLNKLKQLADNQEQVTQLSTALSNIAANLKIIDSCVNVPTVLNGLNIKKNAPNNLESLATSLEKIKTALQGMPKDGFTFLRQLNTLTKQAENLKNLATVFKEAKNNTGGKGASNYQPVNVDKLNKELWLPKVSNTVDKSRSIIEGRFKSQGYSDVKVSGIEELDGKIRSLTVTAKAADGVLKQFDFTRRKVSQNGVTKKGTYLVANGVRDKKNADIEKEAEINAKAEQAVYDEQAKANVEREKEYQRQREKYKKSGEKQAADVQKEQEDYIKWWQKQESNIRQKEFKEQERANQRALTAMSNEQASQYAKEEKEYERESKAAKRRNEQDIQRQNKERSSTYDSLRNSIYRSGLIDEYEPMLNDLKQKLSGVWNKDNLVQYNKELDQVRRSFQTVSKVAGTGVKLDIADDLSTGQNAKSAIMRDVISQGKGVNGLSGDFNETTGIGTWTQQVRNGKKELIELKYTWDKTTGSIYRESKNLGTGLTGFSGVLKGLGAELNTLIRYWTASFLNPYQIIGYVRQGIEVVKELDAAMTEMRKVSNDTRESLEAFSNESFSMAQQIGSTAKQIQNSAADFMRLGYTLQQSASLSKDANIYANVGDMNIDEATEHMISSIKAWGSEFSNEVEASHSIVDRYNQIGMMLA